MSELRDTAQQYISNQIDELLKKPNVEVRLRQYFDGCEDTSWEGYTDADLVGVHKLIGDINLFITELNRNGFPTNQ